MILVSEGVYRFKLSSGSRRQTCRPETFELSGGRMDGPCTGLSLGGEGRQPCLPFVTVVQTVCIIPRGAE